MDGVDKPGIKSAALWAIAGASYIFITRTIGTFSPFIFRNLTFVRVNTMLSFAAAALIVYFYIIFYGNFAKGKGKAIERASYIMLAGSLMTALLFFKGILQVFGIYYFRSASLNLLIPAVVSIISLYFFVTIYLKTLPGKPGLFRQAALMAAFGSFLSLFVRATVIYNYFAFKKFQWSWRFSLRYPLIFVPITVFIFLTVVYFFAACYKEPETEKGS